MSNQFCKSSYSLPPCWFPVAQPGIGNATKWLITFYLVCTTIPKYGWLTRLLVHALDWCVLFFSIPHRTKGNQAMEQNCVRIVAYHVMQCTYRCIPHHANPLCSLKMSSHIMISTFVSRFSLYTPVLYTLILKTSNPIKFCLSSQRSNIVSATIWASLVWLVARSLVGSTSHSCSASRRQVHRNKTCSNCVL